MAIGGNTSNLVFSSGTTAGNVSTPETDLLSFTLPKDTLSQHGEVLKITAWGSTANNGNTKTLTFYFGGTSTAFDNFTVSKAFNWNVNCLVIRTGASTQVLFQSLTGNITTTLFSSTLLASPAETLSSDIVVKFTGTGGATNDVVQKGMVVEVLK